METPTGNLPLWRYNHSFIYLNSWHWEEIFFASSKFASLWTFSSRVLGGDQLCTEKHVQECLETLVWAPAGHLIALSLRLSFPMYALQELKTIFRVPFEFKHSVMLVFWVQRITSLPFFYSLSIRRSLLEYQLDSLIGSSHKHFCPSTGGNGRTIATSCTF